MDSADRDPRREVRVQSRMFLGIGAAIAVMAAIYVRLAYEEAGSVMLVLAAGLAFVCGGYLWIHARARDDGGGSDAGAGSHEELYLPHASIWPFWLGLAAFLLTNGLVLGIWFLVPGGVLLALGVVGFVRQSRART